MFEFLKIGTNRNTPVGNQQVSGISTSTQTSVNNYNSNPQISNNNKLVDNTTNRVIPQNTIDTATYTKTYQALASYLNKEDQQKLQILHTNRKLSSTRSNNGSSTIENLYKIASTPRAAGINPKIVLKETLSVLADPYIITQDFGKLPEAVEPELRTDENIRVKNKKQEEQKLNRPSYEKKEILKPLVPFENIKENAVALAQSTGVKVTAEMPLDAVFAATEQKLLEHQKKVGKDPKKIEMLTQQATLYQALREAEEDINFSKGHTCPAASIEFDMADKKPAEFARYVERLTSPDKEVKTKIKYTNIADDVPEAISKLRDWRVDYKKINKEHIEVTLKPDVNAYPRAIVQEYARAKDSRSTIDTLLQSTFMQTGSQKTYNSLTDLRSEDTGHGRGLNQEEAAFVQSVVDDEGGKDSVTYMELDENLTKVTSRAFDAQTTEKQLTETLLSGRNIMVGFLTDVQKDDTLASDNGHEVLLTGIVQDKSGKRFFKYNDTDDGNHYEPSYIEVNELIHSLHHANLPKDVIRKYLKPEQLKDQRFALINDYWELKKQNKVSQIPQMPQNKA
jgi:hypothetical protein